MVKIPLSNPHLTFLEKQLVMQVLSSSQLSMGPMQEDFESKVSRYAGAEYAVAVNSGTSALHLCIKALEIEKGDQVITTPFSFVASANCILYEHATPIFVDIDPFTYNIDVEKIRDNITPRTRAILPVHIFGLPCDMRRILEIAAEFELHIIEDACEAIGAECLILDPAIENNNDDNFIVKKAGSIGDCGAFAFYPNKQITTGEGGVVVTNSRAIAKACRSLRNQGRSDNQNWLEHERLGYNYRLSELNCALGVAQMQHVRDILLARERVAQWYNDRLEYVHGIFIPVELANCRRSWFVYVIRLSDEYTRHDRERIMAKLQENGIECRSYFQPIHLQPFYMKMFGYKRGDFPNTERTADRTIALPFFTGMTENQVDRVCSVLYHILKNYRRTATPAYTPVVVQNTRVMN